MKIKLNNQHVTHDRKYQKVTELVLEDTVKTIGDYAFHRSSLKTADLGTGLTEVSYEAFSYCSKLETVSGKNITTVKNQGFDHNKKLKIVNFPNLKNVEEEAFSDCTNLKEITLNLNKKPIDIASFAFYCCYNLKTINGSKNIKSIESGAFKECASLEELDLEKVETIDFFAFENCKNLKHINLGDKLQYVAPDAFEGCNSLDKETWLKLIAINPKIILGSMPEFHQQDREFMKQCRKVVLNTMINKKDTEENRDLVTKISNWTHAGFKDLTYGDYINEFLKDEKDK